MFHRKSSKNNKGQKEVLLLHFKDIKYTTKSLQIATALNKQWEKIKFGVLGAFQERKINVAS